MKLILRIFIVLLSCSMSSVKAQVILSGRLNDVVSKNKITLTNFTGYKITASVNPKSVFFYSSPKLQNGFYELEEIGTIYLSKGYNLKITPVQKRGAYIFKGNGALENNALQQTKKMFTNYLPLDITEDNKDKLAQEVLYMEPAIFLQKLADYKSYCKTLFNSSSDSFFRRYAYLDIEYYCKPYLEYYYLYYGQDREMVAKASALLEDSAKGDPEIIAKKYIEFTEKATKKTLSIVNRLMLHKLYEEAWDKNDEVLFKNSLSYREAFEDFFSTTSLRGKYLHMPYNNSEDRVIRQLAIANDTITNPYILNYFRFQFCSDIINSTKDTSIAGKYYRQFVSQNTRQDFYRKITEIYQTKIRYSSGMPAPLFTFKNSDDKPVVSKSLTGKYVYIDVWATWCGPCKSEIPFLQKIEEEYKDKNIQFVSISVDEKKDKKKWRDYVTENKLGGIQLLADSAFNSSFIKNMGINAIPRFILIDPNGKLVQANALRPSDEGLRKLLDEIL